MESAKVVLVDENDREKGFAEVAKAHLWEGKHHRAFVTLLFDSQNRVLLQKRKHKLFDGLWDLTAISHPLKINGRTETNQEASDRALFKEMGINHVSVSKVGSFNYTARDGANSENEYCAVLTGTYSGKFKANPKEVYGVKQIPFDQFLLEVGNGKYTPWAREAAKILSKNTLADFTNEMAHFLKVFTPYSNAYFDRSKKVARRYPALISYFWNMLSDFSEGGKKLRSYLVWLGFRIGGGKDINKILSLALAMELIHNFFLTHDDIIDKSDLRRNRQTVHKRFEKKFGHHYGLSQGMLAGDILVVEAFRMVEEVQNKLVSKKFAEVVAETIYGQILDVEYSYLTPTVKQINYVGELKTAKYSVVGPLMLGYLAASKNPNEKIIDALSQYGYLAGMAFQMTDDEIGLFGDSKTVGKSMAADLREGKNTLLIHKAFEMANKKDALVLKKIWGKENATLPEIEKVKAIIEDCGALAWSRTEAQKLAEKAKIEAEKITSNKKLSGILSQVATFCVTRTS